MADEVTMGMRGRSWTPMVTVVDPADGPDQERSRSRATERGAVTAEAAVVIPLLLAVTLGLVWLVALAATQVRVVDAAREAARSAARGDSDEAAVARGREVAPGDASFHVVRSPDEVMVRVVAEVRGPGGLLAFLPAVPVSSEAVAAAEPQ
jgi:Flp pilus assembly protein TadG